MAKEVFDRNKPHKNIDKIASQIKDLKITKEAIEKYKQNAKNQESKIDFSKIDEFEERSSKTK